MLNNCKVNFHRLPIIYGIDFVITLNITKTIKMKKVIILSAFAFASMGQFSCQSNKSVYQQTTENISSDFQSGYFDQHVKGNEYEVTYRGVKMNQNKVFDLSMLRAAEIAKNKGFKHFVVLSKVSESTQINKQKINSSTLKVALYNDVPAKYQTFYDAHAEYDRLTKKYNLK